MPTPTIVGGHVRPPAPSTQSMTKVFTFQLMPSLVKPLRRAAAAAWALAIVSHVSAPSVTFATDGAYIVFDVERGPMFHLRSVTVSGPAKQDAGVVTLLSGDDASHDRVAQARQNVAATLERHGRPSPPRGGPRCRRPRRPSSWQGSEA